MAEHTALSVRDIHVIHDRVVDAYDLDHPGIGRRKADHVLQRIVGDASDPDDPYVSAATYLKRLIEAHVFEDGNKRTAWLATVRLLHQHGETAAPDRNEVATVLKHVRRYRLPEIAEWLETGEIDRSRLRV